MKTNVLPLADAPDGSEEVIINQGVGAAQHTKRMPAAALASAANRPTPAELQAAIMAALVEGTGIDLVVDEANAKIVINVDGSIATVAALNAGLGGKQGSSPLLTAIAGLSLAGQAGKVIKVNANGDGFVLAVDDAGTGGGGALVDGTYGDVIVSNGGTKLTVSIALDEAYGAGWNADMTPPTKNATYAKIESLVNSLNGKVSTASVGVANGVASLDGTGKVPAAQLPSYVDDVLEFSNAAAFPNPGETGKVYVALDTNKQSRWSGTAYVELTASPGTTDNVPEGPTNKYYTDIRVRAAPMTGLVQTVGAPAGTDSLLTILGKLWRQSFSQVLPLAGGTMSGSPVLANGISLQLKDTGGGSALLTCQGDNNLCFYSTDATGAARPVWSVMARSNTATFGFAVGVTYAAGLTVDAGVLNANGTDAAYGVGIKQSRPGQVGYHMYNGGGTAEWITYQPAHAAGDDYRIATYVGGAVTDRFKIGADGAVTIPGTLSGGQIWTTGAAAGIVFNSRDNANTWQIYNQADVLRFWSGADKITMTRTGILTAQDIFANRGDGTGVIYFGGAGSTHYLYWDGANYQLPGGGLFVGGNISSSSDRRLKSDIRPLEGASEIVASLRAYRFTMNDAPGVGVIAQEVEEVLPELVSTDEKGFLAVDYGQLAAVLIADNNALRARLEAVEAALARLAA